MFYTQQDISQYNGKNYYLSKAFPEIPLDSSDIYIITTVGDSLTFLANTYYKDVNLWKIISIANNNINGGSIYVPEGTQLRIPMNISSIISLFQ